MLLVIFYQARFFSDVWLNLKENFYWYFIT